MANVIFIADGWGSKYGGINSFNYDLCLNLPSSLDEKENKVICITTGETITDKDNEYAEKNKLILINVAKEDFRTDIFLKRISKFLVGDQIWWIGHDIKTGFLAIDCAQKTKSKCAIIHHMNYDAYYTYAVNNAQKTTEKHNEQIELFKKADIIFSVGPKLTKSANDILRKIGKSPNSIQLIPGIADIEPINETMEQFSAITFGRIDVKQKDIIKQSKLALAAFAAACKQDHSFISGDTSISLVGLEDNEIEDDNFKLREWAMNYSERMINVKAYPFTENRIDLFNILRSSSVCMMLSIHEGFGLVGWEAISAGVPLIVSENSGLYEFLKKESLGLEVYKIDIKGDIYQKSVSKDISNVSLALREIKEAQEAYKHRAVELRNELIKKGYTWSNTALTLINGLGIESKRKSDIKKMVVSIKEKLKQPLLNMNISDVELQKLQEEFEKARVYNAIGDAYVDISKEIETNKYVKVHGIHCSTFCPEAVNAIANILIQNNNDISIEVLSANPFSEYVKKRLLTIENYNTSEKELIMHHRKLYETARTFKGRDRYQVRFFNTPIYFRLIFTKEHLYMSNYRDGVHARFENVFCLDKYTTSYNIFNKYYKTVWENSNDDLPNKPEEVPSEQRYILSEKWPVSPSLVINVSSACNMKCEYCPKGGENLIMIDEKDYCSMESLSTLVKIFPSCGGNNIVRITGGEPLLNSMIRQRTNCILKSARQRKYKKIILCTNAVYIKEAYEEDTKIWESVKELLLLKISLDTLNEKYFKEITKSSEKTLKIIKDNIEFISKKGFNIELNVVAKKQNVNEILDIFEFAKKLGLVGIKILTVNDFGKRVKIDEDEQKFVEEKIREIAIKLKNDGIKEYEAPLHDGVGIRMKRFIAESNSKGCTLTIVDHNNDEDSITPKRTFCEFCEKCSFYPCATGIMNLTLRADGMLGQCRLKTENTFRISNRSKSNMEKHVTEMLKPFRNCFSS